jgi:hypothetical protein
VGKDGAVYDQVPLFALSVAVLPAKVAPEQLPVRIETETGFGVPELRPELVPGAPGSDAVPEAVTPSTEPVSVATADVGSVLSTPNESSAVSVMASPAPLEGVKTAFTSYVPSGGMPNWPAIGEVRNSNAVLHAVPDPADPARLMVLCTFTAEIWRTDPTPAAPFDAWNVITTLALEHEGEPPVVWHR